MIVDGQGVPLGCWPANAHGVPLAVVERRFGRVADFHGTIAKIEDVMYVPLDQLDGDKVTLSSGVEENQPV